MELSGCCGFMTLCVMCLNFALKCVLLFCLFPLFSLICVSSELYWFIWLLLKVVVMMMLFGVVFVLLFGLCVSSFCLLYVWVFMLLVWLLILL